MFFNDKIILYVVDNGFYIFRKGQVRFDTFLKFDDDAEVDSLLDKLGYKHQVDVVLDLTEEEVIVEQVPKINFIDKIRYKKIISLKHTDNRVFKSVIDFVNYPRTELARIYAVFGNAYLDAFFNKIYSRNILLGGVYLSSLFFEKFITSKSIIKKLSLNDVYQRIFVLRRSETSYRVLYFYNNKILLSRVIELPEDIMIDMDRFDYISREIDMTLRYLGNSALFDSNDYFRVLILDDYDGSSDKIESDLNQSFFSRAELFDEVHEQKRIFSVITPSSLCNKKVIPGYMAWFACALKYTFYLERLPDTYSKYVQQALGLRIFFLSVSFLIFVLGSYYLGSLTSQYFFISEKIDELDKKISYLSKMKSELENAINIPYDARDLQKIVKFSEIYPDEAYKSSIVNPITDLAKILDRNPLISLTGLKIKRVASRAELIGQKFSITADFFINKPSVLYSDNMKTIYGFGDQLSKIFDRVSYVSLPVEVNPAKGQNINDQMIMPDSVPFTIQFYWEPIIHE